MTRTQFEMMSLNELIEWAQENLNSITTEDTLLAFAKAKIDDGNLFLAIHILKAIWESEESYNGYYHYDYNMGALETPMPITYKVDLEDLIYFEDEDRELYM